MFINMVNFGKITSLNLIFSVVCSDSEDDDEDDEDEVKEVKRKGDGSKILPWGMAKEEEVSASLNYKRNFDFKSCWSTQV